MSLYNRIIDIQKLNAAWSHVKKNKPAAGVDNVTTDQFEGNIKENIKQLHFELENHAYEPLPVKLITIYKEEKAREIALYAMRDKVVQQSIAFELNKIFNSLLSTQVYAYRSDHSALSAIEEAAKEAAKDDHRFYLKADISHFFDTIRWDILRNILSEHIREEDVIELIRLNSFSKQLDVITGELTEKRLGLYQGSGIAPILSNIYMMRFDSRLQKEAPYYIRYSDDMIVFGESMDQMVNILNTVNHELEKLGLSLNQNKSSRLFYNLWLTIERVFSIM